MKYYISILAFAGIFCALVTLFNSIGAHIGLTIILTVALFSAVIAYAIFLMYPKSKNDIMTQWKFKPKAFTKKKPWLDLDTNPPTWVTEYKIFNYTYYRKIQG